MSYYLRIVHGAPMQVWKIERDTAIQVGITNPGTGIGTCFKADQGETIWEAIKRNASGWFGSDGSNPFHKTVLGPGEFYPRMARPTNQHPTNALGWNPSAQIEANIIAIARGQLTALTRQLDRICQTVQPMEKTFSTFGHDIRNLLILACTEVETHWRGVLVANGITKVRYDTRDYVALRDAMKLDEYAVAFPNYPWLEDFRPYDAWSTSNPTSSITWYAAYNAAKHNRETEFEQATLRHVFEAISACVIMLAAQFGLPLGFGLNSELRSFFHLSAVPTWPLSEVYIFPYGQTTGDWSPVNFRFNFTSS